MRELTTNESQAISGGLNNGGYGFSYIMGCTTVGAVAGLFLGSIGGGAIIGCAYGSAMVLAKSLDTMIFDTAPSHEIVYGSSMQVEQ